MKSVSSSKGRRIKKQDKPLTEEQKTLQLLEGTVRSGWEAFIEVGLALQRIRDEKLFSVAGYKTFTSYCLARWKYTKSRTSRAINGALIGQSIKSQMPQLQLNEAQVRELIPLVDPDKKGPPNYQAAVDVVAEVVKKQKSNKRLITAKLIRSVVNTRLNRCSEKKASTSITNTKALTLLREVRRAIDALPNTDQLGSTSSQSSTPSAKDNLLADLDTLSEWLLSNFPSARVALAPALNTEKRTLTVFSEVKKPFGELGNMSECPLIHGGLSYKSTEALFQCLRISGSDPISSRIRKKIIKAPNGYMAKRRACIWVKKYGLALSICDAADLERMELCLRLKLRAQPKVESLLMATEDSVIIEDCGNRPGDFEIDGKSYGRKGGPFWGAALVDDVWRGQNKLGELWMKLRDEIRSGKRP